MLTGKELELNTALNKALDDYFEKFGKPVPMGWGGVSFATTEKAIIGIQHAIDNNKPFPDPVYEEGKVP